jgi:two-component system, OmpR family, KDP operon response regulator KdpE
MASPMRQATVFVVDDDDAVRDALTTSLTDAGFAAAPFRSAAEFIEAYRVGGPACLVTELDLPDIDALLHMLQAGSDLPVIVTSRRLRRRRLPDELAACIGLLEKPFGHDELVVMVHAALRLESDPRDT